MLLPAAVNGLPARAELIGVPIHAYARDQIEGSRVLAVLIANWQGELDG